MSEEEIITNEQPPETESSLVEKDGELYAVQPGSESPADSSAPEQESQDKKTSAPDDKKTSEENPDLSGESAPDEDPTYKDKTREEVIAMHRDATRKITEFGQKLKASESAVKAENLSHDELLDRLSSDSLKKTLLSEKGKLTGIDPELDPAGYSNQQAVVNQLEVDLHEKIARETIAQQISSTENKNFVANLPENLKKRGIELKDTELQSVIESAQNYLENGRLTDRAVEHALLDNFGIEKIAAFHAVSAEQKARNDIIAAGGKVEKKIDVSGPGSNAKMIRIEDMTEGQFRAYVKSLSDADLSRLDEHIKRTHKKG
ncbi:MAG: hypothetical protein PHC43_01315 [Candidatus Marinimicrobia bacterium]|jgi:hypothetical protein|nr:hypothetical protein [Candidatus Neomarinimicrobiota bacterium]MDD5229949.1 hypothetical protein [Candidatus Neomarinimicrobiota bacterium]MDD5540141.1 hypothetical protein [Candidatus Neomarinimicrobiota bacterium]